MCSQIAARMILGALVTFGAAVASSSAAALTPQDYFGGLDNQGYLDWISASPVSDWSSTAYLASAADPALGAAVHWFIDNSTGTLELAVATKSAGWMAFGLSPTGGMLGTDLFVVEASNLTSIKDMHVLDARLPMLDECQNWKLLDAQLSDDGFFLVRAERLLDTNDPQDLAIHNDGSYSFPVSHAIAAWGDEANYGYHGASRAHSGIRWHSDGESETDRYSAYMQSQADDYVFVAASNHSVLLNETEYAYFCFQPDDLASAGIDMAGDGVTIIGFEPVIDNARHVHHFILYASPHDLNVTVECSRRSLTSLELLYLWGPGEPPFIFPDDVGMPLGGGVNGTRNAYRSFVLEIHYDNTDAIPNQVDSSGVRTYYTTQARQHEAGVLSVGDPFVYLRDQPINVGLSNYRFECPDTCSSLMLAEGQPVTVIREYMHMHQSGYAMYNEHVRDGQVIRTGSVDFFEFDVSGGPTVQQDSFDILPGDSFNVQCYYQNDVANRTFGLASSQEMCVAFLLYYPRKVVEISDGRSLGWMCSVGYRDVGFLPCDAPVTAEALSDGTVPDRRAFGTAAERCSSESTGPNVSSTGPGGASAGIASRSFADTMHQLAVLAGMFCLSLPPLI